MENYLHIEANSKDIALLDEDLKYLGVVKNIHLILNEEQIKKLRHLGVIKITSSQVNEIFLRNLINNI